MIQIQSNYQLQKAGHGLNSLVYQIHCVLEPLELLLIMLQLVSIDQDFSLGKNFLVCVDFILSNLLWQPLDTKSNNHTSK